MTAPWPLAKSHLHEYVELPFDFFPSKPALAMNGVRLLTDTGILSIERTALFLRASDQKANTGKYYMPRAIQVFVASLVKLYPFSVELLFNVTLGPLSMTV